MPTVNKTETFETEVKMSQICCNLIRFPSCYFVLILYKTVIINLAFQYHLCKMTADLLRDLSKSLVTLWFTLTSTFLKITSHQPNMIVSRTSCYYKFTYVGACNGLKLIISKTLAFFSKEESTRTRFSAIGSLKI